MKSNRLILLLILSFAALYLTNAQIIKKFSSDQLVFVEEFKGFMMINISTDDKTLLENFIIKLTSPIFSEQERDNIIVVSNLLLESKAIQNPHFKKYIVSLLKFKEDSRFDATDYANWEQGLIDLLQKKSTLRAIDSYLTVILDLIDKNVLYKSFSTEWVATSLDYKFVFNKELRIVFEKTNLKCYSKRDSIEILETKGSMTPAELIWLGNGGLVTWERSGLDAEQVRANIKGFKIDLTKSEYYADSVTFINKSFLSRSLIGKFHDKVMQISDTARTAFPEFTSYANEFKIKNLYKGVDFTGGFLFAGSRIIGKGTEEAAASLIFTRSDTILLRASSYYFVITKDRVKGINTSVSIYLGNDSIYHPDIDFNYLAERRELFLNKTTDISSQAPYWNSYHQINMDFGQLFWEIDEPYINLSMVRGSADGIANFKSSNFFSLPFFDAMQGYDQVHPLVAIKRYGDQIKSDQFYAEDFAAYMKLSLSQTRHYLMRLAREGFIFYNTQTDKVRVRKLLFNYIQSSLGKIDYDVIDFDSRTRAPMENAFLDIRNMDLTINGIPRIQVSTAQNVIIFPKDASIIMKRNRDFQFHGRVYAGLFRFFGNNFYFNYDSFKINLRNIDSVRIKVETSNDGFGNPVYSDLRSVIQNVTGELYIDKPNNKSGVRDYPKYPIFNSRENSYVYYDNPKILGGKYPSNSFYFKIDPFEIDSLDNFSKNAMAFDGSFSSSGILPEFRQKLKLQEDLSLGFTEKAPENGYALYEGKGRFFNEVKLDMNGLRGNGKITYLNSTTESEDFIFFPDSMNTVAKSFILSKVSSGVQFPSASVENCKIHWLSRIDKFYATNLSKPFNIINSQNFHYGTLLLEPIGISGRGKLDMTVAEMLSESFNYRANGFKTDTSDFFLKSLTGSMFTVVTKNVNADIDYDKRTGVFMSNDDFSLVEFPENKYISYLDYFVWNMDIQEFQMGLGKKDYTTEKIPSFNKGEGLSGPRYISVKFDQDSLNFVSPKAVYDYRNNLIKASEVKFIKVADAQIFPSDGKVVVEKDALMRTFNDAKIIANDTTAYHTFYRVKVDISSRKKYKGSGKHDYIDENNKIWILDFSNISVNDTLTSFAEGGVAEPDSFMLSSQFYFQGNIEILADQKYMTFKGGLKIVSNCNRMGSKWLLFKTPIIPDSIYIPISAEPKDLDRNTAYAGIFISDDSIHVYPAFISGRKIFNDSYISTANGFLHYNKKYKKYEIGALDKLNNNDLTGNYLSFQQDPCRTYGEGKIDLGIDLWRVGLTSVGNVRHYHDSVDAQLSVLMGLDFFMQDAHFKIMTDHLDSIARLSGRLSPTREYEKKLRELISLSTDTSLKVEKILYDTAQKWPGALRHTLLLNNVYLKWNQATKSYRYKGDIDLISAGAKPINLTMDGQIEMKHKRSGDEMELYLKLDDNNWYYFGYAAGVMYTTSSNQIYVTTVTQSKVKDRMLRSKRGMKPYIYMISTYDRMGKFLKRFKGELDIDDLIESADDSEAEEVDKK